MAASQTAHHAARQLAHRRPRVERVEARIDEPVEAHRGAARADHADDNPRHLRPRERLIAPGQQRPGQRKRQREHRVAEADEREIGGQLTHRIVSSQAIASGSMPADQIFFHIDHVRRHPHGDQRCPLPGLDAPVVVAEAAAPARRSASRSRSSSRAGTRGAMRRASASSANMFRSATLARLSVPNATATPARRRLRAAARRRRRRRCCAGTRPAVTPDRLQPCEILAVELHAVHDQRRPRPRKPSAATVFAGRHAGDLPVVGPDPSPSSITRAGPLPCRSSSTSSADSPRCTLVTGSGCASTSARMAMNSAGDTEYGACGARLTRTSSAPMAAASAAARASRTRAHRIGGAEANQLVEHLRRHARVAQQRHRHERVADVAEQSGARRARVVRWRGAAASMMAGAVGSGWSRRSAISALTQSLKLGTRRHAPVQIRQLEMRVGVDQRRKDSDAAKRRDLAPARRSPTAVMRLTLDASRSRRESAVPTIGSTHAAVKVVTLLRQAQRFCRLGFAPDSSSARPAPRYHRRRAPWPAPACAARRVRGRSDRRGSRSACCGASRVNPASSTFSTISTSSMQ